MLNVPDQAGLRNADNWRYLIVLEHLRLTNLGPAAEFDFSFGPRINILTGDNGVGKTFILDVAWWALTRTWAGGRIIHPTTVLKEEAAITYHVHGKGGANTEVTCNYRHEDLDWSRPTRRPPSPGLIIYARIDGGFSLWDPAQNYWHNRAEQSEIPNSPIIEESDKSDRPDSFQFTQNQLWEGLREKGGKTLCRGMIDDWETWRLKGNGAFAMLAEVINALSPGGRDGIYHPGDSVRLPETGPRDIPTLHMPYGNVPINLASAGIKRILSLAYMIVWAWTEHKVAAQMRRLEETKRIVLLWDEVEAHLHPQWQRTIVPSVVGILQRLLAEGADTELQVIATTHAPLVLASLESVVDNEKDRLFNLEVENGAVRLEPILWSKFGDAISWLQSPAFDMRSGYSREAEKIIDIAQKFLASEKLEQSPNTAEAIENEMRRVLADTDPFWARWLTSTGHFQ